MLSLDQRKSRLEELLDRVRRNRDQTGPSAASSGVPVAKAAALPSPTEPPPVERHSWSPDSNAPIPEPEVSETERPVAMSDASTGQMNVDISDMQLPESEAAPEIIHMASAPEPVDTEVLEPDEELVSVTVTPEPESEPEPVETVEIDLETTGSVTVTPEPESVVMPESEDLDGPDVVTAAADEEDLMPPESDEPITIIPSAPEPEPIYAAPPSAPPVETRTFDAQTEATSEVLSVRGERPRDWTLSAVLDRAWRVGSADTDKS